MTGSLTVTLSDNTEQEVTKSSEYPKSKCVCRYYGVIGLPISYQVMKTKVTTLLLGAVMSVQSIICISPKLNLNDWFQRVPFVWSFYLIVRKVHFHFLCLLLSQKNLTENCVRVKQVGVWALESLCVRCVFIPFFRGRIELYVLITVINMIYNDDY